MSRFEQEYHQFDEETKKNLPISYNFLYKFSKRGIIKKRGDAYYGVRVDLLDTQTFFPWGHTKPISKTFDFSDLKANNNEE